MDFLVNFATSKLFLVMVIAIESVIIGWLFLTRRPAQA
jgi:hypothetical protein